MYKKIYDGEKVYLAKMRVEDVDTYVKWMNDENVTRGLIGGVQTVTREDEENWIKANIDTNQFAIVRKKDDKIIGNCGFNEINDMHKVGVIGIFIGEVDNRNKGFGTDAVRTLVKYGFEKLNLHVIMLTVYAFNEAAIACYKKVGFKECGKCREACFMDEKRYDKIMMDILREEVT